MKIPTHIALNLAYLEQISEIVEDKHKSLAAQYGFIAKKIALKNLVSIKGSDPPKLKRCKACQAPINCDNIRVKKKKIVVTCSLCKYSRPVGKVVDDDVVSKQKPASASESV